VELKTRLGITLEVFLLCFTALAVELVARGVVALLALFFSTARFCSWVPAVGFGLFALPSSPLGPGGQVAASGGDTIAFDRFWCDFGGDGLAELSTGCGPKLQKILKLQSL
jgi:hypothetical protein